MNNVASHTTPKSSKEYLVYWESHRLENLISEWIYSFVELQEFLSSLCEKEGFGGMNVKVMSVDSVTRKSKQTIFLFDGMYLNKVK